MPTTRVHGLTGVTRPHEMVPANRIAIENRRAARSLMTMTGSDSAGVGRLELPVPGNAHRGEVLGLTSPEVIGARVLVVLGPPFDEDVVVGVSWRSSAYGR